ncbi:CU044_2847 family protein [Streptomyces sp. WAC04114]|uniref:CU044_2847 family protein n=1 Tax=Streptomyces sp. WAC04114 TaxID=2867961 RepID=UPI0021AB7179|nr:CU044_2847 family protein [Streptomyces sp. WAC04114]
MRTYGGVVDGLVEFKTGDGAVVAVEAVEERSGARLVSRGGTVQAARTFEGALDGVRAAAESALRVFRDGSLRPDGVEIEFGVKLAAETGAFIAKGTAEGHLVVKLTWSPSTVDAAATPSVPHPSQAASTPNVPPTAEAAPTPGTASAPGAGAAS